MPDEAAKGPRRARQGERPQLPALIRAGCTVKEAPRQDLARVRLAWEECQASRERNAIYGYLSAVFDLVMWWAAEGRAISRARWALQLQHLDLPITDEPFAAVIRCTSDPGKVDKRTRSKWLRVMRHAAE